MSLSSILRSPHFFAAILAVLIFGGAPWAVYSVGLFAAGGRPELPKTIADPLEQAELWQALGGLGDPTLDPQSPYTYVAVLENPGPERPGLLAAYRVTMPYIVEHRRFEGRQWWSLSSASLTIWLSRNWTIEQILSKLIEMRGARHAAPDEAVTPASPEAAS